MAEPSSPAKGAALLYGFSTACDGRRDRLLVGTGDASLAFETDLG